MKAFTEHSQVTLSTLPAPAKALVTCIIVTLAVGMLGAFGQIVIHDIIPTFSDNTGRDANGPPTASAMQHGHATGNEMAETGTGRGDLFADLPQSTLAQKSQPFYKNDQFVWTLKWTHIHLFGMNMIFILMGTVTLLLDLPRKTRTWLIVLPFGGVLVDIAAMWLKGFVSPLFFWLHIPGGLLFTVIFGFVALRAIWEMWRKPAAA